MSENAGAVVMQKVGGFYMLRLFSRHWILATLLVLGGIALTIRLGIWQLDRLEQRRLFNARVTAQLSQPVLELNGESLGVDLRGMEYRSVVVSGEYDFSRQVGLRNQVWENEPGVRLLTPLKIQGTDQYILVERGWVPGVNSTETDWRRYDEPGLVHVSGMIRASESKPDFGRRADPLPAPGKLALRLWHFANVDAIARQLPYSLLPVYVQQAPDPTWSSLPHRSLPELEITEGPHMSYALQWFSFATLLAFGYPYFVFKRSRVAR